MWFASTIKHEVKNTLAGGIEGPANAIMMYYLSDLGRAFEEKDGEWFSEICGKIKTLTGQILNGSRKVLDITETTLGGLESDDNSFRRIYFRILWDEAKKDFVVKGACTLGNTLVNIMVCQGALNCIK